MKENQTDEKHSTGNAIRLGSMVNSIPSSQLCQPWTWFNETIKVIPMIGLGFGNQFLSYCLGLAFLVFRLFSVLLLWASFIANFYRVGSMWYDKLSAVSFFNCFVWNFPLHYVYKNNNQGYEICWKTSIYVENKFFIIYF